MIRNHREFYVHDFNEDEYDKNDFLIIKVLCTLTSKTVGLKLPYPNVGK